jgi:hypothetical protein
VANVTPNLKAALVECAFPDELGELAHVSNHLTPSRLKTELDKLQSRDYPVYIINIKPMYRERVIRQIDEAGMKDVHIFELGKDYDF